MPRRKTQKEFEEEVLLKLGKDYKVLGKYINKNTKIEMIHYVCGNTFLKNPHDVSSKGSGCPYCNGNRNALYNEDWVKNNTPLGYKYVKGYKKMSEKCEFYCSKCNSIFKQTPARLINEKIYGCNCSPTKKKTHEDFINELGETINDYNVLSEYNGSDKDIKLQHKKCGVEFTITPYSFIYKHNKKYCPVCFYKKSKGEALINEFLSINNIEYHKEFTFPDLKNRRFDFYIPSLNVVIEYDGIQHFTPVEHFGGVSEFNARKRRDLEKNQYCLKNNISLYRLPYSILDNLNEVLHKIFKEKSSTTIEKYLITE